MNNFTFSADDIFEDIPDDPDNVMMKIPDEILEVMGWKVGDTLEIHQEGKSIILQLKPNPSTTA